MLPHAKDINANREVIFDSLKLSGYHGTGTPVPTWLGKRTLEMDLRQLSYYSFLFDSCLSELL